MFSWKSSSRLSCIYLSISPKKLPYDFFCWTRVMKNKKKFLRKSRQAEKNERKSFKKFTFFHTRFGKECEKNFFNVVVVVQCLKYADGYVNYTCSSTQVLHSKASNGNNNKDIKSGKGEGKSYENSGKTFFSCHIIFPRNFMQIHMETSSHLVTKPSYTIFECLHWSRHEISSFFSLLVCASLTSHRKPSTLFLSFFLFCSLFSLMTLSRICSRERKIRGERRSQYLVFCQTWSTHNRATYRGNIIKSSPPSLSLFSPLNCKCFFIPCAIRKEFMRDQLMCINVQI